MSSSNDSDVFWSCVLPPAFVVFWAFILCFPWDWLLYSVMVIELGIFLLVFSVESQAQHVSGASGWILFLSFFMQMFIVVGLTILRAFMLLAELFVWLF